MATMKELPLPGHYDPAHARDANYNVDTMLLQQQALEWRAQHKLTPVGGDRRKVHLLIIDAQFDFSFPQGSLYVAGRSGTGAMDDNDRIAQFVYRNLHVISQITCTADSHLPFQVFHPSAHLREDGSHPDPFTLITAEEYRKGVYRPNPAMAAQMNVDPAWLARQFIHYCSELERSGKYALTIWPYHTLLASHGHRLVGVIDEARLFHGFARGAENRPEIKGGNPLTEHYSIFKPEVMTLWDGKPIPGVQRNERFINALLGGDVVIIMGQAKSHCVAWSIDDLLGEIMAQDPALARKVYLAEDGTSPVVIPGVIDYTDDANAAFDRFVDAGMHVVRLTEPMETWPDINL